MLGAAPAVMCRSDALRETTSIRMSAKSNSMVSWVSVRGAPTLRPDGRSGAGAAAHDARDLGDRGAALADLLEPVVAQPAHPVAHRQPRDLVGGGALDDEAADLVGD